MTSKKITKFTIRVYGLLINDRQELLVSDERIRGGDYTKLPGGGLELGEGTRDCLKREFQEEAGVEITVGTHVYTTDFFIASAFASKSTQFFGIYYLVHLKPNFTIPSKTKRFDYHEGPDGLQCFRWLALKDLNVEQDISLETDQIAVRKVLEQFS